MATDKKSELLDKFAASVLPTLVEVEYKITVAELERDGEPAPEAATACWDEKDRWENTAKIAYAIAAAMIDARRGAGK